MKTKYIYITSRKYTSAVYQTQIVDWLNLYISKGLSFELWQVFRWTLKPVKGDREERPNLLSMIRSAFKGKVEERFALPYRRLSFINKWNYYRNLKKACIGYDRVVVFSRDLISEEIEYVKNKMGSKLVYYVDLRGALAEEYYLTMKNKKQFSKGAYHTLANLAYSEYHRQFIADKIFVVSNTLKKYYIDNFNADGGKFVLYPCLSTTDKFYYDEKLRYRIRKELNIGDDINLYVYSGGLSFGWHIPDTFLRLFIEIAKKDSKAKLLIMSPNLTDDVKEKIHQHELLNERVILKEAVPNNEVVKYLNAADFGILLRENNPVNNVASPSKYAEYILCGLPTIISESINDYAHFCKENNCGYVLPNSKLDNMEGEEPLVKTDYDRKHIADIGKRFLSKESAIDRIIDEMQNIK